jgi:uncharacterized protein YjiS (DUF1127 family)
MLFIMYTKRLSAERSVVGFVFRATFTTFRFSERPRNFVRPITRRIATSMLRRRCRIAVRELYELDDHTRRDIGISRSAMD